MFVNIFFYAKLLLSKYMFLGCSKEFKPCYFVNLFNAFKKIILNYFFLHNSSYEPFILFYWANFYSFYLNGTIIATAKFYVDAPCKNISLILFIFLQIAYTFYGATYSPCCNLNIFFFRSIILSDPFGWIYPTSPVCNQPSASRA